MVVIIRLSVVRYRLNMNLPREKMSLHLNRRNEVFMNIHAGWA